MEQPICLVGIGKIAVDQHVPSIAQSSDWTLAATVSRAGSVDGVSSYTDFDVMLAERSDIRTISLCLPAMIMRRVRLLRVVMSCWKNHPAQRWPRCMIWLQWLTRRVSPFTRHGTAGWPKGSLLQRRFWPVRQSQAGKSCGKKTCAAGIQIRIGCSSRAAWACLIPASTRCRS